MSHAKFNSSINEVKSFLKEVNLFKSQSTKVLNSDGVSSDFKSVSHSKDYFMVYKTAIKNYDFDFILKDDSILQFEYKFNGTTPTSIRFAFFQNPQFYKSYEEFLEFLRKIEVIDQETNEEIGSAFEEEYQQFLTEEKLNISATSIRYDVDPKGYKSQIHPLSHFHIGHQNHIRIPCSIILTPMKFTLFVIKHIYYYEWKEMIELGNVHLITAMKNAKSKCNKIDAMHWNSDDVKELFLI